MNYQSHQDKVSYFLTYLWQFDVNSNGDYIAIYDIDSNENSNGKFLCKTLVSVRVSKPRGIALDPNAGLMFFSVWGSDTAKIERAQLV